MTHEPAVTRNAEALLSGAGCAPKVQDRYDFRLRRLDNTRWQIETISSIAEAWIREMLESPLTHSFDGGIIIDVLSVGRLLKEAHARGLKTEFIRCSGTDTI